MSNCKEIQCTNCDHSKVCSLKDQFSRAQNSVNGVTVGLEDKRTKYLRDFDWIKPVNLECEYFTEKRPTMRDISNEKVQDLFIENARIGMKNTELTYHP